MSPEKFDPQLAKSTSLLWLADVAWKAYLERYPLKVEASPIWANEVRILKIAGKIIEKIVDFDENKAQSRKGVVLAIGHRGDFYLPPVPVKFGDFGVADPEYGQKLDKYTDYALFKSHFLVQHPELVASSQNTKFGDDEKWKIGSTELPGGAFAFKNGTIIGISGFSNGEKDTAAALTIGIASHLIREQVAVKVAKQIGCNEFYLNRSKYLNLIQK